MAGDLRLGLRLGLRMLRPKSRGELASVAVTIVAMAMVVSALCTLLGMNAAIAGRHDLLEDREPRVTAGPGTWVALRALDVGSGELVVYDVAPRRPGLALPPGLSRWPEPGEVVLSPGAAAERRHNDYLEALTPGRPVGAITRLGLRDPDEWVAYVGRPEPDVRALSGRRITGFGAPSRYVEDMPASTRTYVELVGLALIGLGGYVLVRSVGILTASTRRRRLAALQLLGASGRLLRVMGGLALGAVALAGALLGLLLVPVAGHVISGAGLFGIRWWIEDLFPSWPLIAATIVACVALAGRVGAQSVDADPWAVRRRAAERSLSPARLAPLVAGTIALVGVVVAQQRAAEGASTPSNVVWLGIAAGVSVLCGLILGAPILVRWTSRVAQRGSLVVRLGAARADHHARVTAHLAAVLVALVLASGLAAGAVLGIHGQNSLSDGGPRHVEMPGPASTGEPPAPEVLSAALNGPGLVRAEVSRAGGGVDPLTSTDDVHHDDVGYVFTVAPDQVQAFGAAVVAAWPTAPPLLNDRYIAGQRISQMASGAILISLFLCVLLTMSAMGVALVSLQEQRADADGMLLLAGMPARQLARVRAVEVLISALPAPGVASVAAVLLGLATMRVDHVGIDLPLPLLPVLPLATVGLALTLAGVAAALAPRSEGWVRRD